MVYKCTFIHMLDMYTSIKTCVNMFNVCYTYADWTHVSRDPVYSHVMTCSSVYKYSVHKHTYPMYKVHMFKNKTMYIFMGTFLHVYFVLKHVCMCTLYLHTCLCNNCLDKHFFLLYPLFFLPLFSPFSLSFFSPKKKRKGKKEREIMVLRYLRPVIRQSING